MSVITLTLRTLLLAAWAMGALAGCAVQPVPASATSIIATTPQLSTFSNLMTQAGLNETLKTSGPFTVFAPSNDAFSKIPAKSMDALSANTAELKALLAHHVVPSQIMAADVRNGNQKTVNGDNIALAKAGDFVTVEDAMVQRADIAASNGVVHVIDNVLMLPGH
jgi:uncharacterized surface protein with fasciclin (FAS1) repeats